MLQQIINGLMLGSSYAMVAVALTLSIGILNFLNFSIPGLFMLGGMLLWAAVRTGISWPLAVLIALVVVAAVSMVVEIFTWRWMRKADGFVPLVSSMAFLILLEHLMTALYGSDMRSVAADVGSSDLHIAGVVLSVPQIIGFAISTMLIAALSWTLGHTQAGRGLRTIAENADTASMLGVNVQRTVTAVFVVAGLFAALAGILFAVTYRQVHPFMGEVIGLKGISAMIVGGMGNIWGALVGGLIIGLTEVLAIHQFGADFVDIAVFGMLLTVLVIRPRGLMAGNVSTRGGI